MKKRFISLFTGAGGLDQGFIDAGWEPAFMVDNWKPAINTLEANHPNTVAYLADLSNDPEGIVRRGLDPIGLSRKDILCVIGGPPCLPEGESVITKTGLVPIEMIKCGQRVLSISGKYNRVVKIGSKPFSGIIYGIRPQGCLDPVWFTGNHPIYVKRENRIGFISANMIIPRDRIGFPIVQSDTQASVEFLGYGKFSSFAKSDELWFLLGAYVGDGYLRGGSEKLGKKRYEIVFCPGSREGETAKVISESLKKIGLHYYYDLSGGLSNIKIHIHDKAFWNLCVRFGRLAPNKQIPECLLALDDRLLNKLIEGICVTDGYECPKHEVKSRGKIIIINDTSKVTSVSLTLLKWIQRALLRFGILGGIRKIYDAGTTIIEGRRVKIKACYDLVWIPKPKKTYYTIENTKTLWVPVKQIVEKSYDGLVYNLEVERDHTFCGHLIGTHNCQTFSRLNQNQLFEDGTETEENLNDPRRSLFMDFLHIVRYIRPPFMVMENVFDLKTRRLGGIGPDKDRAIISVIVEEIEQAGYCLAFDILRTQDYNVPQMRKRMIFIGVRKDLDIRPSMPPSIPLVTSIVSEFAKIRPEHPNQDRKSHSEGWLEKVRHIPQGGYYNNLPLEHKVLKPVVKTMLSGVDLRRQIVCVSKGYCFRTMGGLFVDGELPVEIIRAGGQFFKVMPRMGTYLRRIRETISHTVTRNPLIHPVENREITVREKAAIQTFPPEYRFVGTVQEQHVLVGNAVPCNLGKAIAEHIGRWQL